MIDRNEFFRQATLKICGNLALEQALHDALLYIGKFIPIDVFFMEYFDREQTTARTIARARIARTPVRRTASKMICVTRFGSRPKMLPNPKYTGGSPLDKNSVKDRGGFQFSSWLRNQYPVTVAKSGQSSGRGIMCRLNPCNAGIGRPSGSRILRPGLRGDSPCCVRHFLTLLLIISNIFLMS